MKRWFGNILGRSNSEFCAWLVPGRKAKRTKDSLTSVNISEFKRIVHDMTAELMS